LGRAEYLDRFPVPRQPEVNDLRSPRAVAVLQQKDSGVLQRGRGLSGMDPDSRRVPRRWRGGGIRYGARGQLIFWLALDERGTAIAKRANGYTGQRVSTHATEFAWQQYATVSDAVAYTYQENGHSFWVIRFPTAKATWVYDISTGYWHQRGFWQGGQFTADRSTSHMFFNGQHLVGDWATGNIYQQSMSFWMTRAVRCGSCGARRPSPKRINGSTSLS
jgi:hypothetical protein